MSPLCHVAECYGLEHSLYQHYSSFVRASVRAASVAACSARCHEAAYCNTFSYTADTSSSPNCLLSALLRAELSVSGDLVSAPSWAVYRYHVLSRYVTLCHAVQPRPWPGLQLLQRGRAGGAASSAAVPPRGEAGRGVLHLRGQVRHDYLYLVISKYLHIYFSVAGTRGLQPTCSTAAAYVTRPPTADPSPTSG